MMLAQKYTDYLEENTENPETGSRICMQHFVYNKVVFWLSELRVGGNDCWMNILALIDWIFGENLDHYLPLNFKYTNILRGHTDDYFNSTGIRRPFELWYQRRKNNWK